MFTIRGSQLKKGVRIFGEGVFTKRGFMLTPFGLMHLIVRGNGSLH